MNARTTINVPGILLCLAASSAMATVPLQIGSRLEPMVDAYLIERLEGGAALRTHRPEPQEVVLVTDQPWEGNTCAYYTVFRDGDLLRMYYRGSHFDESRRQAAHHEVTCFAQSEDGVHWVKPNLGLYEFGGSRENNIVWDGIGSHCFAPFRDDNPDAAPDARYKAVSHGWPKAKAGIYVFKSPDGIHWSMIQSEPVITRGDFDSQNLAFWDPHARLYREYHRVYRDGVRDISACVSADFLRWTEPVMLSYPGAANEHLYTNAILPYERAPHILLGFPTRFLPKRGSRVEPVFMAARDGRTFHRRPEPIIPEDAPQDRAGNRSNYMAWGLVRLPGDDKHFSVYATEAYYTGPNSRLRRFTYRVDGFVSVHGPAEGGQLLTKVLAFTGRQLVFNYATTETGFLRVELQDVAGHPIEGFTLADCPPFSGDAVRHTVTWNGGADVGRLAGLPIRIRVEITDGDLYSLKFEP